MSQSERAQSRLVGAGKQLRACVETWKVFFCQAPPPPKLPALPGRGRPGARYRFLYSHDKMKDTDFTPSSLQLVPFLAESPFWIVVIPKSSPNTPSQVLSPFP